MTGSMLAASLLANLVSGRPDPLEEVVSPRRFSAAALGMALAQGGQAVKGLARRFLPAGAGPASVAPGSGGVVKLDGRTMGVWREEDGRLVLQMPGPGGQPGPHPGGARGGRLAAAHHGRWQLERPLCPGAVRRERRPPPGGAGAECFL